MTQCSLFQYVGDKYVHWNDVKGHATSILIIKEGWYRNSNASKVA